METPEMIVRRVPGWQDATPERVERLGGLTNQNYLVSVHGERYVLRVSGQNTTRLGINREHEVAALRAAAAAGLAPQVVAFIQPEGHLVTRWAPGRHWPASEFRVPANVRLLTETARRIHALPPNGAVFSPFQRVAAFLQSARDHAVDLPAGCEEALRAMQSVADDQRQDGADWQRLCHNDLVSVNYLYDEERRAITVLDWEFAGLGDVYYDLATIVYTHDSDGAIEPELEEEMLACYFGTVTPFQRRRLLGMKFMLVFFSAAWGVAQYGMQRAGLIPPPQDFDYLEFAQEMFEGDLRTLRVRLARTVE